MFDRGLVRRPPSYSATAGIFGVTGQGMDLGSIPTFGANKRPTWVGWVFEDETGKVHGRQIVFVFVIIIKAY